MKKGIDIPVLYGYDIQVYWSHPSQQEVYYYLQGRRQDITIDGEGMLVTRVCTHQEMCNI